MSGFAADAGAGERMHALMEDLYPICRSITGDGVRETLAAVGHRIPLDVHEVPSATPVLDWTVPDEWNIRDAYIADANGERVVDLADSTLHVVSYSEPVHASLTLAELRPHLHSLPDHPDRIPYRTSYYERSWGFCLTQRRLDRLRDGIYEVVIDGTLEPGSLTYGECVLSGEREEEVLLTTHVCHPSLANDNLSGIALLTELGAALAASRRTLSYRLLFIPGTIGSIAWLAGNEARLEAIVAGLVLACVGDSAPVTYKRTRRGAAWIDRAAEHVLDRLDTRARIVEYEPWGWDERQFNSQGVGIPVGCLSRSRDGEYDGYHSSADDLEGVTAMQLQGALTAVLQILDVLESDRRYVNLAPRGEPQLGRRGLYPGMGGREPSEEQMATLWVLSESDGDHSLLDIADRSGLAYDVVRESALRLEAAGLLAERRELPA
jgi:aminopeptidase-like protein